MSEQGDIVIKGFEAIRSDVADVTVEAQKEILEWILRCDEDTARRKSYEYLRSLRSSVLDGEYALEKLGKRQGLGQDLDEYGHENLTPGPTVRGAKYANEHIDGVELSRGDNPMRFYVDRVGPSYPSTYSAATAEDGDVVDAISVDDPSQIPGEFELDMHKHFQKTVREPTENILQTLDWSWQDVVSGTTQQSLSGVGV